MRHAEARISLRLTGDLMSKLFIPTPLSAYRTTLATSFFIALEHSPAVGRPPAGRPT